MTASKIRNLCGCGCGIYPARANAKYVQGHRPRKDPAVLFWAKVDRTAECWNWTGAVGSHGYGVCWAGNKIALAHRFVLALSGLDLDNTMQVDHLCRNRICVRPDHLEQVPQAENNRRALRLRPPKTHCPHGHDYAETGFLNAAGYQECRTCVQSRRGRPSA